MNLYTCPTHAINILLPGGLLGSVRAPFVSPFSTTYGYDAAGRSTVTTLPNGTTASSTYDNAGRLTVLENKDGAGTTVSRHEYTLDGNGNRTAADEVNGSFTGVTTFGYDDVNRLIEAAYPSNQATGHRRVTYAYNDGGDRTELKQWTGSPGSWSPSGSTITYAHDTAGRITTAAGVNYTHDNNGNQTGRGSDTFTFDPQNRMTGAAISGGATTTYAYDGNGVRTKKTVGSTVTDYLQDANGGLPLVAAEKVGSAWTYYLYGKGLIARRAADLSVQYYHYDGAGNVRAITDASGAVIERYDYDVFGALRNTPTGVANDRRMTGEQHDAETGYTFLRARQYDPALGRFTGVDAIRGAAGSPQTFNRYAYVGNNPANRADPSGQWQCFQIDGGTCAPPPCGVQGRVCSDAGSSSGRGAVTTLSVSPKPPTPPACPRRTGGGRIVSPRTTEYPTSYVVAIGEYIRFTVFEYRSVSLFGFPITDGALVWDLMAIQANRSVVFNGNYYHHEVGHIFQQAALGEIGAYQAKAAVGYLGAIFSPDPHDNPFEREANCFGGMMGDQPYPDPKEWDQ